MADYRIRVKVGANEFDAEGTKEFVEESFRRFETLIAHKASSIPTLADTPESPIQAESPYAKAFNLENNRLSLIGRFNGEDRELDAALLVLLGHKEIKGSDAVSADDLLYGLKQTGYPFDRADRLMKRGRSLGLLNFNGVRRGTRYRLTAPGITRAKELAKELIEMFQVS